ncbi:MAG: adenine deaminase [Desulfobacterales bacterium]
MGMEELIAAARGDQPSDLLITDARIVNVFSGEIIRGNIAIKDSYIAGIGDYEAKSNVSVKGCYVCPGFIDPHVHIESTMTGVSQFAAAVLARGTTTVVADPHEIANVLGTDGIAWMLAAAEKQLINVYFTLPSCVPATEMETAGAELDAETLTPLLSHERILGLGEMMNFQGVINRSPEVLGKIKAAAAHHKPTEGHSPGVSGKNLAAYIAAGILSDHECVCAQEAIEKLRAGMYIMIRQGTGARNLDDLLPIVSRQTWSRVMWCTDDRDARDILTEGHIDSMVRRAINAGLEPITAICMGTINPASYFGLHSLGAIAPGRRADLVVLKDLEEFELKTVYCAGQKAAEHGEVAEGVCKNDPEIFSVSMNVKKDSLDFRIPARGSLVRVIGVCPASIVTSAQVISARIEHGEAVSDIGRDMIKLAVVERHRAAGNIGLGFVSGFGMRSGAIAGSVAHDSHNIIAAGVEDTDIKAAVEAVIDMGGGLVVVDKGRVTASLALPTAGLMSELSLKQVAEKTSKLNHAAAGLGTELSDPFMSLSFLALPVIPELRLTDLGLFDVARFRHVSLFAD